MKQKKENRGQEKKNGKLFPSCTWVFWQLTSLKLGPCRSLGYTTLCPINYCYPRVVCVSMWIRYHTVLEALNSNSAVFFAFFFLIFSHPCHHCGTHCSGGWRQLAAKRPGAAQWRPPGRLKWHQATFYPIRSPGDGTSQEGFPPWYWADLSSGSDWNT